MEGFYTIEFHGASGVGGGVAMLSNNTVLGGDSAYLYKGNYRQDGDTLTAQINVQAFMKGVPTVLPIPADNFTLEVVGKRRNGLIEGTGIVVGYPQARLNIKMTKQ